MFLNFTNNILLCLNMKKFVYITTVGNTPLAVINSFWCVVRSEKINVIKVYLLCSETDEKRKISGTCNHFEEIKKKLLELAQALNISLSSENIFKRPIAQEKIDTVYKEIIEIYKENKIFNVCIDITGGRKTMSSGAMLAAKDLNLNCYYFWLYNPRNDGNKTLDEMTEFINYELIKVHQIWRK